jgi:hypothetical protein
VWVQCPVWLCSVVDFVLSDMLLRQCLSDFEMVPVALIYTGVYYYYHYYYYYYYYYYVSGHRPILPGNSLEPRMIPTAQASSLTMQYFLYYV